MPETDVQSLFNRIAPVYDSLNQWLSLGHHRLWKQMTVKWSGAKLGDRALDVCCGSGDLTQLLARRVGSTGQVVGVDFSTELLAIAQQRVTQIVSPLAITWVEADALDLPFPDASFDAVTMGYGLRNVSDISRSLQELQRVLKPGGKAAILDFNHPTNPLIQTFQTWYLGAIVVPLAQQFGVTDEYAYIASSLERFPPGEQQVKLAEQVGFAAATHYAIAGGTMGVLVVTK